jgi:hypothetical protein
MPDVGRGVGVIDGGGDVKGLHGEGVSDASSLGSNQRTGKW